MCTTAEQKSTAAARSVLCLNPEQLEMPPGVLLPCTTSGQGHCRAEQSGLLQAASGRQRGMRLNMERQELHYGEDEPLEEKTMQRCEN